ncbi:MAG: beta-lactamase family protein [Bryobacterales bacterium]|nr:beta-lactamase family protein [Bryobacterales bacterium]
MKLLLILCITQILGALDLAVVEKTLQEEMAALKVPGAAMVVVERGKAVLAKGYGVRSVTDTVPVNERTLFRIGSTAKIFTALAALRLAEGGKLDLHAPIGGHATFGGVTVHQLLTHTAGLRDDAPQDGPHDESALSRNADSYGPEYVLAPPGKLFSYANTGYVLAGSIIERAAGKPFAAAVRELVLAPYGMTASTYRPFEAMLDPLALPHDSSAKLIRPFPDHAGAWPPGSLFTNAEDMAKFLVKSLPEKVTTPQVTVTGSEQRYGYGIILEEDRWFHTGGRLGYGSRFEIYPREGVAIFLMGNRTGALFGRTAAALRNQVMRSAPPAAASEQAFDEGEARRLAGVYVNRGPLRAELEIAGGELRLKAGTRSIAIRKLGEHFYRAPGGAQLERFRVLVDRAGNAEYLCAEVWCLKRQQ